MEKTIITFSANEQKLIKTGGIECYASNIVSYIEAHFDLGQNWSGYDSVRAVWSNDNNMSVISTVLDSNGVCVVPFEVLKTKGIVKVNLVGSISVSDVLTDRLTTFPCEAVKVTAKAKIEGSETQPITPSQFEQFVAAVISEVEKVTGMTAQAETLPAGSQATARYENGILYLGIPQGIQGERGETGADGNGIASVVYNADYSLTLVFDNGEQFRTPPIRGERGPAGADGRDGTDGADGVTPNISIGNVETLEPSEDAYVTRRGTDANPIFDFGIPKGDTGTVPDLDLILPTDTASGDIVSITDGQSVVPVKSLKVTLEPIQSGSGTPSPDNVRPISGHTEVETSVSGVNVWDEEWEVGGYAAATGSPWNTTDRIRGKTTNYISVVPNTSYRIYSDTWGSGGGKFFSVFFYDADKNYISYSDPNNGATFTTPNSAHFVRFAAQPSYGTTYKNDISINYPSTDHDYHAYQGTTYTTDLGRTVYGADVEVVGGELTDKMAEKIVDENVLLSNVTERTNTVRAYVPANAFDPEGKPNDTSTITAMSNIGMFAPDYVYRNDEEGVSENRHTTQFGFWISIAKSKLTTPDKNGLLEWLGNNPIQIIYPLATPQTYQLTPQTISLLHGNNNVWSDGSVELTYNADVGLYIDKKLGTSGTRTLSMTRTVETKSEETKTDDVKTDAELTKSDNIQLAED